MGVKRDHGEIPLEQTRGLFKRDSVGFTTPEDHLIQGINYEYLNGVLRTRLGLSGVIPGIVSIQVKRFFRFERSSGAARYIWLDPSGNLYDTGAAAPSTPIIASATSGWGAPTDFAMLSINDRAYLSPHNRLTGTTGKLFVYDPSLMTAARKAAGSKPGSAPAAAIVAGGNCEPGQHIIAVSFETNTGFITKPAGTRLLVTFTTANRTANLTAIPLGGSSVVARWILMTGVINGPYSGNPLDYELFKAVRIGDNSSTTLSLSIFDGELKVSVDYLEDVYEEIPAGLFLDVFASRMMVGNVHPTILTSGTSTILASNLDDSETFDKTDGYIVVDPSNDPRVTNFVGQIDYGFIFKSQGLYVTRDNLGSPSSWPVDTVDASVGAECMSVGRTYTRKSLGRNSFVFADRSGLHLFNGGLDPMRLSWKIQALWDTIIKTTGFIEKIQVCIAPVIQRIYVLVPSDADAMTIFVCDYSDGLAFDAVKWTTWQFQSGLTSSDTINCIESVPPTIDPRELLIVTLAYDGISGFTRENGQDYDASRQTVRAFETAHVPRQGDTGAELHANEAVLAIGTTSSLALLHAEFNDISSSAFEPVNFTPTATSEEPIYESLVFSKTLRRPSMYVEVVDQTVACGMLIYRIAFFLRQKWQ